MAKYQVNINYRAEYCVDVIAESNKKAEKKVKDSISVSFGGLENNDSFSGVEKLDVKAHNIRKIVVEATE